MSIETISLAGGCSLQIDERLDPEARATIVRGLIDHTEREAGIVRRDASPLSVFVRDSGGDVVGGLNGVTIWGWLEVKELWVAPPMRGNGFGTRIMIEAEREAVRRGCHHAMLDTFDFQARPFYERLGYRCWGELPEFPRGHSRFFLAKELVGVEG